LFRLAALLPLAAILACGQPAPEAGNAQSPPAAAGPASSAPPETPGLTLEARLAGITNVEIVHYDVRGDSLFAIRRALNQAGPRDPNDGQRVDALALWYIQWRWPDAPGGGCDLSRAEIRFSASVRMPRLVAGPDTPEAVRLRWQRYVTALERHEANHIRRAWDARESVLAAIRASSCANANADARAAIAIMGRRDVDYDRTTRHGLSEGAHFP